MVFIAIIYYCCNKFELYGKFVTCLKSEDDHYPQLLVLSDRPILASAYTLKALQLLLLVTDFCHIIFNMNCIHQRRSHKDC